MKVLSIAVAVSLVLACVHFLGSSAAPFPEVQMEIENSDSPAMGHEETADHSMHEPLQMDSSKELPLTAFRVKRHIPFGHSPSCPLPHLCFKHGSLTMCCRA